MSPQADRELRFYVCITGRNVSEEWTEKCLESVLEQRGAFQRVIDWTDDASDNEAGSELAYRWLVGLTWKRVLGDPTVLPHEWRKNRTREGGLANFYRAIHRANDDDVVVLMGGDDWLEPGALERVRKLYDDPECWLTYGTYRNSDNTPTHTSFEWDGCELRDMLHEFLWMPLTCRAWLAKKVFEEDLKIAGYWQWSSGDVALNVPIVEMAGPEHARWIQEPWYVRRIHPSNDTHVDAALQYFCSWRAYGRPRYSRIKGRDDVPERTPHRMHYGLAFKPDGNGNRSMPQGIGYGEAPATDAKNTAINAWVQVEVRKSIACPECKGMRRCDHG